MKSFEQLGRAAYEAFFAENVSHGGQPAPLPWKLLDFIERDCWVAAAKKVAEEIAAVH